MGLILHFLTLNVMVISSYSFPRSQSDGCSREVDENRCFYIYNCTRYVDFNQFNIIANMMEECQGRIIEYLKYDTHYINNYIQPNNKIPSLIIFDDSKNMNKQENTIPLFRLDQVRYLTISLDISNNLYTTCPTLASMNNLFTLNLSHNMLSEAMLSNPTELPSLTEINFSHNIINTIEVNNIDHAYHSLKKINISYNYLANIPDGIFDKFNEIENLDLSHNYIYKLSVLSFEGIRNLLHLNLSHNRISDIETCLVRFNKLITLDLSNNKLENVKVSDFEKLYDLTTLDLSYNSIVHIHQHLFNSLVFLHNLDLSHNLLEEINKEAFANLTKLVNINLSKNALSFLPKDLFRVNYIETFSIEGNRLNGHLVKGVFEGLSLIRELDLSKQKLTFIEDFAFFGLGKLNTLLLNNNNISTLSNNAFRSLQQLKLLDLSNNQISNIDFDKSDLISIRSLILNNNHLIQMKSEYFVGLNILSVLDLASNQISELESNSFKPLNDLVEFKISNNPISGILKENTFDGLNLLPNLDISGSLLTALNNNSFKGMTHLKELNISRSRISELQFNTFSNTGAIEILDLSYNQLKIFDVNTSALINMNTLILNNNFLTVISSSSLKGLLRLNRIILSYNSIKTIDNDTFIDQKDLRLLDLSFNPTLKFNVSQIENFLVLATLFLSGIRTDITFKNVRDSSLLELEMSQSGIKNITKLELKHLKNVNNLKLNNNDIATVKVGAFSKITQLRKLDLCCNQITFIQPGVFKDNILLYSLNVSHNLLTTVSYGIFSGLIYLHTIDISYNNIGDLETERFHEVTSLTVLIADYNQIHSFNANEFLYTSLSTLSIGGNPLPCSVLVALKKMDIPFAITAIDIVEKGNENVYGVTCNVGSNSKIATSSGKPIEHEEILVDIRDILRNLSNTKTTEKYLVSVNNDAQYLPNITKQIEQANNDFTAVLLKLTNLTSNLVDGNKNTNSLLDRMLKQLTGLNILRRTTPQVPVPRNNETVDLVPYINKIKQELEDTIAFEKQNILAEVESKISSNIHEQRTVAPTHEALSKSEKSESKSFVFVEVCVGMILVILVGFVLYKVYNSGIFVPSARSYSTRNLPDAMENSAL